MRLGKLEVHRIPMPEPWSEIKRLIDLLDVDHVVDVGANVGEYARGMRDRAGFGGRIDCFEPQPRCVATLQRMSDVVVHPVALGAQSGSMDLTVYQDDSLSSLRQLNATGVGLWGDTAPTTVTDTVRVPIETLGVFLSKLPSSSRTWVKLDTQGFDLEVLRGAAGLLDQVVAIQSELAFTPLYEDAPEVWEHLHAFADAGFRLSSLHPITRVGSGPIAEADGIFVRDEAPRSNDSHLGRDRRR